MATVSLSHECEVEDFVIHQGRYWSGTFQVIGANGQPIDLASCVLTGHARRDRGPSTPIAFSYNFSIDVPNKSFFVWINESQTSPLVVGEKLKDRESTFYYDWELTDSLGKVHRIRMGRNWIDREQTRL